jgi:hypothetical protein
LLALPAGTGGCWRRCGPSCRRCPAGRPGGSGGGGAPAPGRRVVLRRQRRRWMPLIGERWARQGQAFEALNGHSARAGVVESVMGRGVRVFVLRGAQGQPTMASSTATMPSSSRSATAVLLRWARAGVALVISGYDCQPRYTPSMFRFVRPFRTPDSCARRCSSPPARRGRSRPSSPAPPVPAPSTQPAPPAVARRPRPGVRCK